MSLIFIKFYINAGIWGGGGRGLFINYLNVICICEFKMQEKIPSETQASEGIASAIAASCSARTLEAAWESLKSSEALIARFIDNKVIPKGPPGKMPSLAEMRRTGVEKNSIEDDNPVRVVFNDGSALLLNARNGVTGTEPAGTYNAGCEAEVPVEIFRSPLL